MLNEDQIIKKLYDQVKIFKDHMMRKEYLQAVLCADQASMVVMCLIWEKKSERSFLEYVIRIIR